MRHSRNITTILIALLLSGALPVLAAPLEVFVSIPPQKWLTEQLGGDRVSTHILVNKGQDPHTYEPSPKQIASLSRAKLYFTIGMEFEEQITRKLEAAVTGLTLVDTTSSITRIDMQGHGHDHETEAGNEHAAEQENHHQTTDPHVWLSPLNLIKMAETMATAMIAVDPDNTAFFRENLQRTTAALSQLHQQISSDLAPFKGSAFYVFHPSFGYFARDYHLQQEAVEISGTSPSPRQLSALITRAKEDNVRIIFVQPQFDTKSAATVAQAINGVVEPLDALAEDVAGNLQNIATQIKSALKGANGVNN